MRPRNLYPLGSGGGNYAISQLHESHHGCWRPSRWAAAIPRWRAPTIQRCAASVSGWGAPASARTFSPKTLRRIMRGTLEQERRLSSRHAFPDRTEGRIPAPRRGILHRQSRNAASGKLHGGASAAQELCRYDVLGVHSFPATNSNGETRFIKFKVVPVGGKTSADRGRDQDEA